MAIIKPNNNNNNIIRLNQNMLSSDSIAIYFILIFIWAPWPYHWSIAAVGETECHMGNRGRYKIKLFDEDLALGEYSRISSQISYHGCHWNQMIVKLL